MLVVEQTHGYDMEDSGQGTDCDDLRNKILNLVPVLVNYESKNI